MQSFHEMTILSIKGATNNMVAVSEAVRESNPRLVGTKLVARIFKKRSHITIDRLNDE